MSLARLDPLHCFLMPSSPLPVAILQHVALLPLTTRLAMGAKFGGLGARASYMLHTFPTHWPHEFQSFARAQDLLACSCKETSFYPTSGGRVPCMCSAAKAQPAWQDPGRSSKTTTTTTTRLLHLFSLPFIAARHNAQAMPPYTLLS